MPPATGGTVGSREGARQRLVALGDQAVPGEAQRLARAEARVQALERELRRERHRREALELGIDGLSSRVAALEAENAALRAAAR